MGAQSNQNDFLVLINFLKTKTKTQNLSYQKQRIATLLNALFSDLKKELFSPRGSIKKFCKFSSKGDQIYRILGSGTEFRNLEISIKPV